VNVRGEDRFENSVPATCHGFTHEEMRRPYDVGKNKVPVGNAEWSD
jgi:hypothetical protein